MLGVKVLTDTNNKKKKHNTGLSALFLNSNNIFGNRDIIHLERFLEDAGFDFRGSVAHKVDHMRVFDKILTNTYSISL